jgi:hypothetical protein
MNTVGRRFIVGTARPRLEQELNMAAQDKCHRGWKTTGMSGGCCGAPMVRVRLDEGIVWSLMWLPPQGERA